jgi:hypothetical protein
VIGEITTTVIEKAKNLSETQKVFRHFYFFVGGDVRKSGAIVASVSAH